MEKWFVMGVDTKAVVNIREEQKKIPGVKLQLLGDAPDDADGRYLGQVVREQFISDDRRKKLGVDPMPGDMICLYFNRFGDIDKIDILESGRKPYGA